MKLYGSITGCTGIDRVDINESHSSSSTIATITCKTTSLVIGDQITCDIGYTTDHGVIFTGHVKKIERETPEDMYTIVAYDKMIQAVDFYIAPDDPDEPFSRQNIAAEDLVGDVLELAGLTGYSYQETFYTLAVNGTTAEVKLISAYDYAKSIANLLAWHLWADRSGVIQFRNRKPYVMTGASMQPGDIADTSILTLASGSGGTIEMVSYRQSEEDLRNRVVVWGPDGVAATSSAVSPYLPTGFYKTILFSNSIIGDNATAKKTADYNLELFNRLTKSINIVALGDTTLQARTVITINEPYTGLSTNAYVFACQHSLSQEGYLCNLDLRI